MIKLTGAILTLLITTIMHADKIQVYLPPEVNDFASSYPYVTGNTLRCFCDHVYDISVDPQPIRHGNMVTSSGDIPFDPYNVQPGDSVFVMFYFLDDFFKNIHPYIMNPYVLVTHSSDHDFPTNQFAHHLDDPKILAWFAPDTDRIHPKLKPLPIGLSNKGFWCGDTHIFDRAQAYRTNIKDKLLYMNFSCDTDPERQELFNQFNNKPYCTVKQRVPLINYLHDLSTHKFTLSPRGSGIDCHRTWEALMMDCYPIVKTSPLDAAFEHLPVVIVNDWKEITPEFLEEQYNRLSASNAYRWEKLHADYWVKEIQSYKDNPPQETHSLIFVHLGDSLPTYLHDALKQARLFNQAPIYLLGNQKTLHKFAQTNTVPITLVPVETLHKSKHHETFIKESKVDKAFRNNYFFYVCERHLWIHDFMEQWNRKNIFQLETDVMIYVDLATLLPLFEQHYDGIAIAYKSDLAAVPGIYYAKNSICMEKLASYLAQTAHRGDNDMRLLAEFGLQYGKSYLDALPIITNNYVEENELISPMGDRAADIRTYTNHINDFKSIFDGDAIGMYLGGEDPRNWWVGEQDKQAGRISPYSVLNASHLHYTWEIDEQGRGVPFMHYQDQSARINLIHIHAKKLHCFLSLGGTEDPNHVSNLLSLS